MSHGHWANSGLNACEVLPQAPLFDPFCLFFLASMAFLEVEAKASLDALSHQLDETRAIHGQEQWDPEVTAMCNNQWSLPSTWKFYELRSKRSEEWMWLVPSTDDLTGGSIAFMRKTKWLGPRRISILLFWLLVSFCLVFWPISDANCLLLLFCIKFQGFLLWSWTNSGLAYPSSDDVAGISFWHRPGPFASMASHARMMWTSISTICRGFRFEERTGMQLGFHW